MLCLLKDSDTCAPAHLIFFSRSKSSRSLVASPGSRELCVFAVFNVLSPVEEPVRNLVRARVHNNLRYPLDLLCSQFSSSGNRTAIRSRSKATKVSAGDHHSQNSNVWGVILSCVLGSCDDVHRSNLAHKSSSVNRTGLELDGSTTAPAAPFVAFHPHERTFC